MDALDTSMQSRKSSLMAHSQLSTLDKDGKPKRVFENMTIYKQYVEYHDLKDSLYKSLR